MKIHITDCNATDCNAEKIQRSLDEVNGRATDHTYRVYSDIAALVTEAETRRADLRLSQREAKGMQIVCVSGDPVPRAYKWPSGVSVKRKATWVELTYCATGWCLTDVGSTTIYHNGGSIRTVLPPAVEAAALWHFRTTYACVSPAYDLAFGGEDGITAMRH